MSVPAEPDFSGEQESSFHHARGGEAPNSERVLTPQGLDDLRAVRRRPQRRGRASRLSAYPVEAVGRAFRLGRRTAEHPNDISDIRLSRPQLDFGASKI